MNTLLRPALVLLTLFTGLTGVLYPLVVTGVAQTVWPSESNGSLIVQAGRAVGSELIGQPFDDPRYFWSRPSATASFPYNAAASGGSNLGPLNPALTDAVKARVEALRAADPDNRAPVPVDLVTTSGSGLDPHVSPAAALYQAGRVGRARGFSEDRMHALVVAAIEGRWLGIFSEPRVNVLRLNLALDELGSRADR